MLVKTFYHVSLKENLPSIMKHGLIPQIGERSKMLGEEEAVFLFPSREDMNGALGSWLGGCFNEEDVLVSLEIRLPDDFPIEDSTVAYEKISKTAIPPCYIRYLQDE